MTELFMVFYLCLSMELRDCHATVAPWLGRVQYSRGEICHMKILGRRGTTFAKPMYGFAACASLRYIPGAALDE